MLSSVPIRRTSPRALVADGDGESREVLRRRLVELGHEVVVCPSGEEAWVLFQAARPDVVFAPRDSADVDGVALCRRIRSITNDDGEPYPYVVLITGIDDGEQARAGLEAGADDFLRKPVTGSELEARLVAGRRVVALRSQLRAQQHELARLNDERALGAGTDPLTGLASRLRLDEDMATMQGRMARYGHQACIAVLDIDRFKRFNDAQGHAAGDAVLREIAGIMKRTLRAGDLAYRTGGEEFVCLFPEIDAARGRSAADRIRFLIERAGMSHPGSPYGVITVSAGVAASAGHEGVGITELLALANRNLHAAKALGRNRVQVDSEEPLAVPDVRPAAVGRVR